MPKMKTKSGAKKRFRVTAGGKVKAKQAYMRHMQMNKPKSMKRKARGQGFLCEANNTMVLDNWLPYQTGKKPKAQSRVSKYQKKLLKAEAATAAKGGK